MQTGEFHSPTPGATDNRRSAATGSSVPNPQVLHRYPRIEPTRVHWIDTAKIQLLRFGLNSSERIFSTRNLCASLQSPPPIMSQISPLVVLTQFEEASPSPSPRSCHVICRNAPTPANINSLSGTPSLMDLVQYGPTACLYVVVAYLMTLLLSQTDLLCK